MPETPGNDPLADRVVDVIDASLQIGASIARSLAGATGSPDVAPTGNPPIDDIVTYGTATATNLIGLVASGARTGLDVTSKATAGRTRQTKAATPSPTGGPIVAAGSTLRVPLLVENTGGSPTRSLTFETRQLVRDGCEDAEKCTCLPAEGVTFTPETLVIAARDFEKLTVRIAAPVDVALGDYQAVIVAGDGWFSTVIKFAVVA